MCLKKSSLRIVGVAIWLSAVGWPGHSQAAGVPEKGQNAVAAPAAPKDARVPKGDDLREVADTINAPIVYKDLMLVLVTKNGVAAVVFTREVERGVEYKFRYESADGKTQKVGTGRVTEKGAPARKPQLFIEAGPLPLRWSYADNGKGWIYYNPSIVAVHPAKAADFEDRLENTPFDGAVPVSKLELRRFLRK